MLQASWITLYAGNDSRRDPSAVNALIGSRMKTFRSAYLELTAISMACQRGSCSSIEDKTLLKSTNENICLHSVVLFVRALVICVE